MAEFFRHAHQLIQRIGLHFLHHLAPVDLDGFLAGAKLEGNLFVKNLSLNLDFPL